MRKNQRAYAVAAMAFGPILMSAGCGIIGVTCGDLGALLCGSGLYCQYEVGSCGEDGEFGVCAPRPEACTLIFAPVCGCDGRTYGNECEAAAAGISVRGSGPCVGDEQICGGLAGFACDDGEFCLFPTGTCGAADETGVCTAIPDFCAEIFAPVCGCDDRTYGNQCEAYVAGVSIVHDGECDDDIEVRVCGGIAGEPCAEGEFCRLPEGQCCCDFQGICEVMPEACTLIYDPVCGCDGVTYGNECEAASAGVSIMHEGSCDTETGGSCRPECHDGEFCFFEEGDCGESGQRGYCAPAPELGPPDNFDPVCGCNGNTYYNANDAGIRGISLRYQGPCEEDICGGIQGLACPENEYCFFEPGTCGAADQTGVCWSIPSGCVNTNAPVCGCDGVTYDNECEAARAAVSVQSDGECP